jgi:peptide/nickel transport system ATP-binding protein
MDKSAQTALRRRVQMIFQDPMDSLNPRHTIGDIIEEPLIIHNIGNRQTRLEKIRQLLDRVGLAQDSIHRYPHEFSGGQRQRIGIARAIALEPELIICDEPVSALDVSVQSQILNLLLDLQQDMELALLFISHDLNVVRHVSDRIAVMYLGQIVELAPAAELFNNPQHPYTRTLLSSIPKPIGSQV